MAALKLGRSVAGRSLGGLLVEEVVDDVGAVVEDLDEMEVDEEDLVDRDVKNGLMMVGGRVEGFGLIVVRGMRGGSIEVTRVVRGGSSVQYAVENGSIDFSFGSGDVRIYQACGEEYLTNDNVHTIW